MRTGDPPKTDEPAFVTTLVINADVTVVLVNNDNATLGITPDNSLTRLVTFKKTGDTLVISSAKNRNLKNAGIIYVPASRLRKILVNSDAYVRSLYSLQIPRLDVVINGACKIVISNIGELNFIETDNYFFEKSKEVYRLPALVLMNKE
jgi:hypothetical protein